MEVEGVDHVPCLGDPTPILDAIEEFVTGGGRATRSDRFLATTLFTDIVGSTETAARLGDVRWRELLQAHHEATRRELDRFGGREVDTAGDGFFAMFDGPAKAIWCASSIVNAVRSFGLEIRAGVHTGECELVDGKPGGIAVSIGARDRRRGGFGENPRLAHREGPGCRLWYLVRRSRRTRAQGRPGPLAPLQSDRVGQSTEQRPWRKNGALRNWVCAKVQPLSRPRNAGL